MGEKNNEEEVVQKKEGGNGNLTVVLKSDFYCDGCEGCVHKVVKAIRSFEGVEKVVCDPDSKKLTVIGKVDPVTLREKVEQKINKPVELVSPIPKPKKDGERKDGSGGGGGEKKKQNNKENNSKKENKGEDKKTKEKELPLITAVFKLPLNCDACNEEIYKIITRTGGCRNIKMAWENNLVTVTGTIDVKSLAESLRYHLRKDVEILTVNDGVYSTRCKSVTADYLYHATEVFSDENPNACSIL